MHHARTDVGPAPRLMLLRKYLLAVLELAADRCLERLQIEGGLSLQSLVEEAADFEELVDCLVDLFLASADRECVDDESVELGVLCLFHPVVLHQALEQRIKITIVPDRAQVMLLRHPFDHEDHESDRER